MTTFAGSDEGMVLPVSDVYSYPEDDAVEDPLLGQHLAHFGIDFSSLKKVM